MVKCGHVRRVVPTSMCGHIAIELTHIPYPILSLRHEGSTFGQQTEFSHSSNPFSSILSSSSE